MLKIIFKQIKKVLKYKLNKYGLKEQFAKHPNYIEKAKEIWDMINEDFGVSDTVENKLTLKVDKFEKALLAKFPELTKGDVTEIKQSIVEEFNTDKDVVDALKQVQDFNTKLQDENIKLKNQLSKFQLDDTANTAVSANETSKTAAIDVEKENI